MKRFRGEFIFVEGEYHFSVELSRAVRFQCENLNLKPCPSLCCNLCTKRYHCYGECPARGAVLIKIDYFERYKKWDNNISNIVNGL